MKQHSAAEHIARCTGGEKPIAAMRDSGKREEFTTGAVRDTADKKPRPDLISPFFAERLGEWLRLGAEKYTPRNWEKGIQFSRTLASLERHVMAWKQGDRSEDHLAAVACNTMFLIHYEEMIRRDVLPANLDDMPVYQGLGDGEQEPE